MPGNALITGGGSGIGAASAVALAAAGWTVTITGRRAALLDAVAAERPGRIDTVAGDVSDSADVERIFAAVRDRHGRLDLLFNNAGMGAPAATPDELSVADWHRVVDVNLTGVFLCTRAAFALMRAQRPQGGRIVNNGSISAHAPRPGSIAYTATKHAVTGLTKATALDGRAYSIACGQLDIGNAATDMARGSAAGTQQADGEIRSEPVMDVADVARALVYMASLPLEANVASMTVMATAMPFVGRG